MTWDVIIPVYNMAAFLPDAVASVRKMRPAPLKIIIVNDGSTDHPRTTVSGDDILWIEHAVPMGKSESRNAAVRASTADCINFLDADDLLHPEKAARHLEFLAAHPGVDAVYGDMVVFEDGTDPEKGTLRTYGAVPDMLAQLIVRNTYGIHAIMWRRSFFERFGWFDPYFAISQDRELYIRSILNGAAWAYLPGTPVYYRRHPASSINSRLYDAAHYNAQALIRNAAGIAARFPGRYNRLLADSIRMLARNANMHGRPFPEVTEAIAAARLFGTPEIAQNRAYTLIEKSLGAVFLERVLRPKFALARSIKPFS